MSRLPLLVCLAGCVASLVSSLPLAQEQQEVQLPLDIQEALAKLQLAEQQSYEEETPRDKRTIGVLRQLFPGLSQTIDNQIPPVTQAVFRALSQRILDSGRGGGQTSQEAASATEQEDVTGYIDAANDPTLSIYAA